MSKSNSNGFLGTLAGDLRRTGRTTWVTFLTVFGVVGAASLAATVATRGSRRIADGILPEPEPDMALVPMNTTPADDAE